MSKRTDIESVLILSAGPVAIGQACEPDYSGAQTCKALREKGYCVILMNSNPAIIMTDPAMADATYVEPIRWATVIKIIEKERLDALLSTMGSRTALNCALDLECHGVLEKFDMGVIGANADTIDKAEDRSHFDRTMKGIDPVCPRLGIAHSMGRTYGVLEQVGFPCIIRPFFIAGGAGGGTAYNREELEEACARGLDLSSISELLIGESLVGRKEYEMEMVRDKKDNCIIVCSIGSFNPMGVHIGGSITVVLAQTLTDRGYQIVYDASLAILREIGVETGGSNVQFGICPNIGHMVVIEINPRVSRSSTPASRATGPPIAKTAAKLAVGCTLDELQNDITGGRTPASFELAIDYVMAKIPRFTLEKLPKADARLTIQMRSVGEVMTIDRTFQEPVQKALRGLEIGTTGFDSKLDLNDLEADSILGRELTMPNAECVWYVTDAFRTGKSVEEVFELARIDEWFLVRIEDLIRDEEEVKTLGLSSIDRELMYKLRRKGFSDARLAKLLGVTEKNLRSHRHKLKMLPVYKRVDICAAEPTTDTTYMRSTYEEECEANPSSRGKVMILGGGPNRISQGIEFDYCCMYAALVMREDGYETITVNCNPGTASTDYDTSDHLYSELVTLEDVLEIVHAEQPKGVIIQYGGQTPLKLCRVLKGADVSTIGTNPDAIDCAKDHERFQQMVQRLSLRQPANAVARSEGEVLAMSKAIDYPLVVRPPYVSDGWAMEIIYQEEELRRYIHKTAQVSSDDPVLLGHFLSCAIEVDIDTVCDGEVVVIGAIVQRIEQADVHSGDSACLLPLYLLLQHIWDEIREQVKRITLELGVAGLMNIQMAAQGEDIFVIEVNPHAPRIVPFVPKCVGESLAKVTARAVVGKIPIEVGSTQETIPPFFSVKEAVFLFAKLPDVGPILGPKVKSIGEMIDAGDSFAEAFAKAQLGASEIFPTAGCTFTSVREDDEPFAAQVAGDLVALSFEVVVTAGTAHVIEAADLPVCRVNKATEDRPHVVDTTRNDEATLITSTTEDWQSIADPCSIRRNALQYKTCCTTTTVGGQAICEALKFGPEKTARRLQDLHAGTKA